MDLDRSCWRLVILKIKNKYKHMKYKTSLLFLFWINLLAAQSNITQQEMLFRCWKAYNANITGQKNYTRSWLKKYDKTYNSYVNNEFRLSEKISKKEREILQKLNNIEENKVYYVDYEIIFVDYDFRINGYCDNSEATDYTAEVGLSQDRAAIAMKYLINNGVNVKRLTAVGYGSIKRIPDNKIPEEGTQNRRGRI